MLTCRFISKTRWRRGWFSSPARPDGWGRRGRGGVTAPGRERSGESHSGVLGAEMKTVEVSRGGAPAAGTLGLVSLPGRGLCSAVCVCAHSIVCHILHRLTRLSASGSPHYSDGKCSAEDNTHMVGTDERWHPARDRGASKE